MLPVIIAMLPMMAVLFSPNTTNAAVYSVPPIIQAPQTQKEISVEFPAIPEVPFYSQFKDIQSLKWQKVGCGVTSLAMVIDYYKPDAVSANTLLGKGIAQGAYDKNAGWIYNGLIKLSQDYGLDGDFYDFRKLDSKTALEQFKKYSKGGPMIASVHYKFDPKSTIPHLVVINGIVNDTIYYNDPASKEGGKQISVSDFLKGWKKRIIVIRPINENSLIALK